MTTSREGPGTRAPKIAVVGCGAIAEAFHLPALMAIESAAPGVVLVDRDTARAQSVAARFGVSRTASDLAEVLPELDGVVIAVPPHLHVPMTLQSVRAGAHVLCEKPLAETGAEVSTIIQEADQHGVTVTVNNKRRLQGSARAVKRLIDEGRIGRLKTIEFLQGEKFDWPAATNGYFGANAGGRGVLFDVGAHVLDLVCWWMGGKPNLVRYEDDSMGGTEAVARVFFERDGCTGMIHLSWLTKFENTFRIEGERGAIEGHVYDDRVVTLVSSDGSRQTIKDPNASSDADVARTLLGSFVEICGGSGIPLVSAADVAPSVAWLDECYEARTLLPMPWFVDAAPGVVS